MNTTQPTKAITISTALKKAGLTKSQSYRNARIGYSCQTIGFEIAALDYEYKDVYGYRNGRNFQARSSRVQKADTRFQVSYHSFSTNQFRISDESRERGVLAFAKMIEVLESNNFVIEKIDAFYKTLTVVGKSVN
jgi:hypothetical protein